jgi:hypothetical protein
MKSLIAAVILGGAFGTASASVEAIDDSSMVVDITVEVRSAAGSVVAHLAFEEETVLTLPLLDRGDGVFGIQTELEPKNYAVVFEIVGEAESSGPVTLTQMGADLGPEPGEPVTPDEDEGLSEESTRMLWLAVALGAASLSVLAFWVLGGREGRRGDADAADEEPAETGE